MKKTRLLHADTLSLNVLRRLVGGLIEKAEEADKRIARLQTEERRWRYEIAAGLA